jgi:hypothetical protein
MNVAILRDIMSCSPYADRRFRGMYHLHLQGRKSNRTRKQSASGGKEYEGERFLQNVGDIRTTRRCPEGSNIHFHLSVSRSQWPSGLRHELSSAAPTLRSWVRIPLRHGC